MKQGVKNACTMSCFSTLVKWRPLIPDLSITELCDMSFLFFLKFWGFWTIASIEAICRFIPFYFACPLVHILVSPHKIHCVNSAYTYLNFSSVHFAYMIFQIACRLFCNHEIKYWIGITLYLVKFDCKSCVSAR